MPLAPADAPAAAAPEPTAPASTTLVIACGALVRELRQLTAANGWDHLTVTYLPAPLHNRPDRIVPRVLDAIDDAGPTVERVLIGYADCGTGGTLDAAIEQLREERDLAIERLPGNHCYEFFAGSAAFAALHEEELGTLFLSDYLCRHFDILIWQGMGLARHPELLPAYFGHYRRVVLLSQTTDPDRLDDLCRRGVEAADRLGLAFEHRPTGLAPFDHALTQSLAALSVGRPAPVGLGG